MESCNFLRLLDIHGVAQALKSLCLRPNKYLSSTIGDCVSVHTGDNGSEQVD